MGEEWYWNFDSFAAYAEQLARDPSPVNTYALIGHMSLRVGAMNGDTARPASDKEAQRMRDQLTEALAQGASGFSTGLYYPPNMHAPTDEVIAVAEALRAVGGIYVTHMRNEADDVLLSIEENSQDRPGGGFTCCDKSSQMHDAGELWTLDREPAGYRSGRHRPASSIRRLPVCCRLDGSHPGAVATGRSRSDYVVNSTPRDVRQDVESIATSGVSVTVRRQSVCYRQAASSFKWTRPMSDAS